MDPVEVLYRDYPYPGHGVVSKVAARMLRPSIEHVRSSGRNGRLRVLDAGCGTGEQALGIARMFPDADVVGIDLSEASLAMARALARRHRLAVQFERRDVTNPLSDLGKFDVIASLGVLHHLSEPRLGFERLRELMAPEGRFVGMVYGSFGKWQTFQLRDALRLMRPDASRDELLTLLRESRIANNTSPLHYLETLVRRARFGPSIPWTEAVRRTFSGRNNAYQADTFTHAREAVFSWAELAQLLRDTGWRFEGWPPNSGMPDRPEQMFRGAPLEAIKHLDRLGQASIYERVLRPVCLYFTASPAEFKD